MPELTAVPELTRVRSMLFMPGTRADMIAKIPRFAPDVAAVDLEDAVAPGDKDSARRTAADAIDSLEPGGVSTVLLRINPVGSPWFAADIAAAAGCAAAGVVVPKLATRDQVREVRQALAAHSRPGALIIAGIETALGVADARTLLTGELSGAYFGAEDYIADIGGRRSPGGDEVLYARSQVSLAAYLAGIPAIDQVVTDIASDGQFLADARRGQALGYQGKMCIHPRQIGLAHEVFTPTPEEVAHARAVVAAGAEGVGVMDGQMVDEVHVRMARAVLARAAGPPDPAESAVSTPWTSEFRRVLIAECAHDPPAVPDGDGGEAGVHPRPDLARPLRPRHRRRRGVPAGVRRERGPRRRGGAAAQRGQASVPGPQPLQAARGVTLGHRAVRWH